MCGYRRKWSRNSARWPANWPPDPLNADRLRSIACCIRPLTCLIVVSTPAESMIIPSSSAGTTTKAKGSKPGQPFGQFGPDHGVVFADPTRQAITSTPPRLAAIAPMPCSSLCRKTSRASAAPAWFCCCGLAQLAHVTAETREAPQPTLLLAAAAPIPRPSGRRGAGAAATPDSTEPLRLAITSPSKGV